MSCAACWNSWRYVQLVCLASATLAAAPFAAGQESVTTEAAVEGAQLALEEPPPATRTNANTAAAPTAATMQDPPPFSNRTLALALMTLYSTALFVLTVAFARVALYRFRQIQEWPEIETHWGGLGGGLGGVRVSPALLCVIAAVAFAAMLSNGVERMMTMLESEPDETQQSGDAALAPAQLTTTQRAGGN